MAVKYMKHYKELAEKLLKSDNPSIRWKIRVNVFDEDPGSRPLKEISEEVRKSPLTGMLLQNQMKSGKIKSKSGVYDKWQGAHWILASLADIGYPYEDQSLEQVKNDILNTWLSPVFYKDFEAAGKKDAYKTRGVPVMNGRHRRCASQQGYALYYLVKLGLWDDRIHHLAERLRHWQWPDGGWNCDKNPEAERSSFMETALPMRGLYAYSMRYNDKNTKDRSLKASEVFLSRRLYKKKSDGQIIKNEFTMLHYPLYWHYDILGILKILSEMNLINDERCIDALDLLESKFIPGFGWPAEKKYYKVSNEIKLGNDYVDWGGTKKKVMNEWITSDALFVLKKANVF
jgi:hypothetical protein